MFVSIISLVLRVLCAEQVEEHQIIRTEERMDDHKRVFSSIEKETYLPLKKRKFRNEDFCNDDAKNSSDNLNKEMDSKIPLKCRLKKEYWQEKFNVINQFKSRSAGDQIERIVTEIKNSIKSNNKETMEKIPFNVLSTDFIGNFGGLKHLLHSPIQYIEALEKINEQENYKKILQQVNTMISAQFPEFLENIYSDMPNKLNNDHFMLFRWIKMACIEYKINWLPIMKFYKHFFVVLDTLNRVKITTHKIKNRKNDNEGIKKILENTILSILRGGNNIISPDIFLICHNSLHTTNNSPISTSFLIYQIAVFSFIKYRINALTTLLTSYAAKNESVDIVDITESPVFQFEMLLQQMCFARYCTKNRQNRPYKQLLTMQAFRIILKCLNINFGNFKTRELNYLMSTSLLVSRELLITKSGMKFYGEMIKNDMYLYSAEPYFQVAYELHRIKRDDVQYRRLRFWTAVKKRFYSIEQNLLLCSDDEEKVFLEKIKKIFIKLEDAPPECEIIGRIVIQNMSVAMLFKQRSNLVSNEDKHKVDMLYENLQNYN